MTIPPRFFLPSIFYSAPMLFLWRIYDPPSEWDKFLETIQVPIVSGIALVDQIYALAR